MAESKVVLPVAAGAAFTCPFCGAYSQMVWSGMLAGGSPNNLGALAAHGLSTASCQVTSCAKDSVWLSDRMVFPITSTGPSPSPDLPEDVRQLYLEALSVEANSPRAAAALLRLAIDRLCSSLTGETNLNTAIGELKSRGLRDRVVGALDAVRVIGNNAVHPGQIDVEEPGVVTGLYQLVNIICEQIITEERLVDEALALLPEGAKAQIERRDGQT
jgi:hypothetical protein